MRSENPILDEDLATAASNAFLVIELSLDEGTFFFSDRKATIGEDQPVPAVLEIGEILSEVVDFSVANNATLSGVQWFINRGIRIFQVTESSGSATDGQLLFDGIILNQPSERDDVLSFSCGPGRLKPASLPASKPINLTDFPNAGARALNRFPPAIYGMVERAELLPVNVPGITSLNRSAGIGDTNLSLQDTSSLPSSGSLVVDDRTYTYTSKDEEAVYGVNIADPHEIGTQASVPETAVYLAAEHAVSEIAGLKAVGLEETDTNVAETKLFDGVLDLAAATVTFPVPPRRTIEQGEATAFLQFDEVDAASTAVNGINAIRAATGTQNQTATSLPTGVTDAIPGEVIFPEPAEQGGTSRIIRADNQVTFNVSVLPGIPELGKASVLIGGRVAWVWDAGQVVFDGSPFTVQTDLDSNRLPVTVVLDGGQSTAFTVNVTAASRTVTVGNLDQAAFAVLRKPDETELIVNQTTQNPNRGLIRRAQLVVEHFSTSPDLDTVEVFYDGTKVGELNAKNLATGGESQHTIEIDTISSGTAELISTEIENALISAFSRLDNAVSIPVRAPISYTVKRTVGSPPQNFVYAIDTEIALPENIEAGVYSFSVTSNVPNGGIVNTSEAALDDESFSPNGGTQLINVPIAAGQTSVRLRHDIDLTINPGEISTELFATIKTVSVTVQSKPSENALSLAGATPTGTIDIFDGTSLVSGVQSAADIDGTGAGTLIVNIPTPPRTVTNAFDLTGIASWADFTGKQVELRYIGADDQDINIVQVFLAVEFERIARVPAGRVIASVTGKSENPADVLKDLIEINGEVAETTSFDSLKAWATTESYTFARRIDQKATALELLGLAAEQISVQLAPQESGIAMLRRLDTSATPVLIAEQDLLSPLEIAWTGLEDIENDLTLNYRSIAGAFTKSLVRNADTPDAVAAASRAAIGFDREVDFDAGWIADDATAQRFAEDYIKLNAPMRRFIIAELPYSFGRLEPGDLVNIQPLSQVFRVLDVGITDGWVSIAGEEIFSE